MKNKQLTLKCGCKRGQYSNKYEHAMHHTEKILYHISDYELCNAELAKVSRILKQRGSPFNEAKQVTHQ